MHDVAAHVCVYVGGLMSNPVWTEAGGEARRLSLSGNIQAQTEDAEHAADTNQ